MKGGTAGGNSCEPDGLHATFLMVKTRKQKQEKMRVGEREPSGYDALTIERLKVDRDHKICWLAVVSSAN